MRILLVFSIVCLAVWAELLGGQFHRTTIESILKRGRKSDGMRVEVQGTTTSGFETSTIRDASTCKGLNVAHCSIWLKFGSCAVLRGVQPERLCGQPLERVLEQHAEKSDLRQIVIHHVVVRGIVSTVRKDITYDKSVPRSARVGFGHLGAYPAQIEVEELQFQDAR